LTLAEGKRLVAEKDAEQKAKERKKKDAAAQRKQKENDREQQCQVHVPDAPFTDSLSSKSKPDLQEIAGMLFLPGDGTKEVLVHQINTFFDSHPQLQDSDRFTGLFNRAPRRRADTNDVAQTQTFNNPPPIPSAPQASGSASQLPLTTNITNLPVAGPSISHNTFPPAPHHFGPYPAHMLQNHYSAHYPPSYPPLRSLSNEHLPSQPASTTLDHTQFYNSSHPNSPWRVHILHPIGPTLLST
jgi:hypothetical protein